MPANKYLLGFIAAAWISCAPPIRDPFGTAVRQGLTPASSAPESLTVDLNVTLRQKGVPTFAARLCARPYRQYRLDAVGLTGVAASYLWSAGRWRLVLNDRREVWEGLGDTLQLEGMGLRLPSVHALFGFLWGDPLPGFRDRDVGSLSWSGDTLHWAFRGEPWIARFDAVSGVCLEASSPALALRYGKYRRFGSRVLAGSVEASAPGEAPLALEVEHIQDLPRWQKDPFVLKTPEGYNLRNSEFPPDDGEK